MKKKITLQRIKNFFFSLVQNCMQVTLKNPASFCNFKYYNSPGYSCMLHLVLNSVNAHIVHTNTTKMVLNLTTLQVYTIKPHELHEHQVRCKCADMPKSSSTKSAHGQLKL